MGRPSKYSSAFKAKVALEALRGDVTLQELAQRYSVSPSKISEWLSELETHAHQAFERSSVKDKELKKVQSENKRLLEKVGQLSIDCDFFCECLRGIRTQSEIIEMEASRTLRHESQTLLPIHEPQPFDTILQAQGRKR